MSRFNRSKTVSHTPKRAFLLAVGMVGIAFACLLAWIGYDAPNTIPGRSYYTIRAELNQADNLTSHYQVRIAGHLVGQVLHPRVKDGKALVDLQMEKDVGPLLSDTTLRVRPRSPIGVRFVELHPGTKGTPLGNNALLPASHATAALPLDTALSTLDPKTRARTRTLLGQLGEGVAGRGEDINRGLMAGGPAVDEATRVTRAIAARKGATTKLIRGGDTLADASQPVRESIAKGFAPQAKVLGAIADESHSIANLLEVAPSALTGTRSGLSQTSPFVVQLGGLAHDALPALRAAPASMTQTAALLREAVPAIGDLHTTLKVAQRAVKPTLGLLNTLNPVLPDVEHALGSLVPIVSNLGPRGCDYLLMTRNWESMLAYGDQTGNYLRFNIIGGTAGGQGPSGHIADGGGNHVNSYQAPCTVKGDARKLGGA
jgi:ABC-type transporter Mla subunit MlaD